MGITIHHRFSQKKQAVKATLDRAEKMAQLIKAEQASKVNIPMTITRKSDTALFIDIGGCETLSFDFLSVAEINKRGQAGWDYEHATLTRDGKELDAGYEIEKYPQNEIYYASAFCKTQYASSIVEHKWVAEITRIVASYCLTAEVADEGDYYHTGNIGDATEAIESLGKMIGNLGKQLAENFGADNIVKGGDTKIKSHKKK